MQISELIAIDTHVHLEPEDDSGASDRAARKYFGDSGAARDWKSLADYYRARKIGWTKSSPASRKSRTIAWPSSPPSMPIS